MKTITIYFGKNARSQLLLNPLWPCNAGEVVRDNFTEAVVVSDTNVAPLYLEKFQQALEAKGVRTGRSVMEAGEQHKTLQTVEKLLNDFGAFGLTRRGVVLALGGGVVGDVGGFCASIWMRGVEVIQMPTTLLSMVDASIGGKNGVDLECGKNLAGAFRQPFATWALHDALKTLPAEYIKDGTVEMLKAGVIGDPELFRHLAAEPQDAVTEDWIARSIEVKSNILFNDPYEEDERALLNLGHTAGHAIELLSHYSIPHGHAVAIGMSMAARAGLKWKVTSKACCDEIVDSLGKLYDISIPFGLQELTMAMQRDKKRAGTAITVVVPISIGKCRLLSLEMEQLEVFWGGAYEV